MFPNRTSQTTFANARNDLNARERLLSPDPRLLYVGFSQGNENGIGNGNGEASVSLQLGMMLVCWFTSLGQVHLCLIRAMYKAIQVNP